MKNNKKILITGVAGFIGSQLTEELLCQGYNIVGLDNFNDYYDPIIKHNNIKNFQNHVNFKLVIGDIRDCNLLNKIFDENKIHQIIHLAAQAGVRYSLQNPKLYMDVNTIGTLNLLNQCKKNNIKRFIFGSSSSVYGNIKKIPFDEEENTYPISPYGASKKAAEILCSTYNHLYKIPIAILRFFTVYGPRQRPDMAIYKFTQNIAENKEIIIYGTGKTKRDYTYISDIINGIISAINNSTNFGIYNLGNSNPVCLSYLVSLIEENLQKKALIKYISKQAGDPDTTFAKIFKAKKVLKYEPKVSIESGIESFIKWYKNL